MYWLQTIRTQLNLSQDELAVYLGLSLHTIKSVETGRRQLPLTSLQPAISLLQAVMAAQAGAPAGNQVMATDPQTRRRKYLHGIYQRRLTRCEHRLDIMQQAYSRAMVNLGIYQHLAQALTGPDDQARRKWTDRKIEETARQVKINDTGAQDPLHVQITILKGLTGQLKERPPGDATLQTNGNPYCAAREHHEQKLFINTNSKNNEHYPTDEGTDA